jgi:hypothetical protein
MSYKKGFLKKVAGSTLDTGWGLIFRLNDLWKQADYIALTGELDKYNDILTRIFVNLLYKVPMELSYDDKKENIVAIDWSDEDSKVFNKLKDLIKEVKRKEQDAIVKKDRAAYNQAREDHYELLLKKDTWLRKFMMEKGLYLKETSFDPERALWGG